MAVELLMVSHGSYAPVTGKVSWGNKPRSGHLLPANVEDGISFKMQGLYLLDDCFFLAPDFMVLLSHSMP